MITACTRSRSPSLASTWPMCVLTVASLTKRATAICARLAGHHLAGRPRMAEPGRVPRLAGRGLAQQGDILAGAARLYRPGDLPGLDRRPGVVAAQRGSPPLPAGRDRVCHRGSPDLRAGREALLRRRDLPLPVRCRLGTAGAPAGRAQAAAWPDPRRCPVDLGDARLRRAGGAGSDPGPAGQHAARSEEHTSELQSRRDLVCRLLLEKKKKSTLYSPTQKKKKKKHNQL